MSISTERGDRGETSLPEGLLADWSLPGDAGASAAFEVARTVCRQTERACRTPGGKRCFCSTQRPLLWLFSRLIEVELQINSKLREDTNKGPRWSRAW